MKTTEFEDKLSELIDRATAAGVPLADIVSALELALMTAKENIED
jgi:hypothetical protein